ncbi:hypothetical protein DAEQUDRAFT_765324 [Daedalea quercina L-15889]|uniref:Uncharacterized protein n=1 Tax=Daedalea quercina L-15889 TaxID=1314783 RepID=A0A165QP46_9APHY|nr:hypothetical protein DAEQUDRAFT_765324 [Daedalea quercina L-15889]
MSLLAKKADAPHTSHDAPAQLQAVSASFPASPCPQTHANSGSRVHQRAQASAVEHQQACGATHSPAMARASAAALTGERSRAATFKKHADASTVLHHPLPPALPATSKPRRRPPRTPDTRPRGHGNGSPALIYKYISERYNTT